MDAGGSERVAGTRPHGRLPDDFWRLWIVGVVIFVVRWMEMLAIAVFVYQRTNSAFIVALMTMLRMVPMALFGAFIGAVADRLERRVSLLLVVSTMSASSAVLAVLSVAGQLQVWHLAVASFVNGIGWATDNPVRRMMLGEIVGADRMGVAMSIDIGANNGSRILGPALGGILLAWGGIQAAFILSLLLYAFALVSATLIRFRNQTATPSSELIVARIAAGLRIVRGTPPLSGTLLITIIFNIFGWPFTSMIPVVARDRLHLTPDGVGLLASMDGIGAFLGAVFVGFYARPSNYSRIYIGSVAAYLVTIVLFAWSPTVVLAGLALFVMGLTQSGFSILQATLVFRSSPPQMRAQLLGVLSMCIGLGPIGFVLIGLLGDTIGAERTALVTSTVGMLIMLVAYRHWRPLWEQR